VTRSPADDFWRHRSCVLQRSLSRLSSLHRRHIQRVHHWLPKVPAQHSGHSVTPIHLPPDNVTIAMHCTLRPPDVSPVVLGVPYGPIMHTTPNQRNRQSNKLRRCYSDLTIWNLGAVRHPDFTPWISTTAWPSRTAPTYQISAQSGKPWLSYWWFNNFSRPVLEAIL